MSKLDLKESAYDEDVGDEPPLSIPKKKKLKQAAKIQRKLEAEQEFKKMEIRDLLRRELELSKKSAEKGRKSWENMCKEIKTVEMRKELVEWEKKVNRVFVQKDEKINIILSEIRTTDEMQQRNYSLQRQIIDFLADAFNALQHSVLLQYETQASEISNDFFQNVEETNKIECKLKLNIENVLHASNLVVEQEMANDYRIFLENRDDRINTEIERRFRLRDSIANKMNFLQKCLLVFLDSLRITSFDTCKHERVETLMERQHNFVKESRKLNEMATLSSRLQVLLQADLTNEEAEAKRRINDLKLEYAYFAEMRKNIESEMQQYRKMTNEKLKILTSESFKLIQKYKKLQNYGELLLSLGANCKKFQTESEKIVPWSDFQEATGAGVENKQFKLKLLDLKAHFDLTEEELQAEIEIMKNFWHRQALAEAQVAILEEKKSHLKNENQHYINVIKRMGNVADIDALKECLKIHAVLNEDTSYVSRHEYYSHKYQT